MQGGRECCPVCVCIPELFCPSSYGSQVRSHDTSPGLLETFQVSNIGERYTKKLSELIFQPDLLCECSPLTNKALYVISTHQRTQRTPAPFELTSNSIATKAVLKLGCWICTWVTSLPRSILGRTGVLGATHARTDTHAHVRTDTHAHVRTCTPMHVHVHIWVFGHQTTGFDATCFHPTTNLFSLTAHAIVHWRLEAVPLPIILLSK